MVDKVEMLDLENLQSSLGLKINFIQYGELKAKVKFLISYYQLNRDPTLMYQNNRPINSFVHNFINTKTKRVAEIFTNQYIHLNLTAIGNVLNNGTSK